MDAQKLPFYGPRPCYACDAKSTGLRDRRPEGHGLEHACPRHADPTIKVYPACTYCDGPVRKGSLDQDGYYAHVKCYKEVSNDTYHRGL